MLLGLAISLFAGTALGAALNVSQAPPPVWQPAVGSRWQIVTKNSLSVDPSQRAIYGSPNVGIFDVDLFNTPQGVIQALHNSGSKVICYFSAGTAEEWRPDYRYFNPADLGNNVKCWPGERYVNIRSQSVWQVMQRRIQYAYSQGCDAIDPDNIDVFSNAAGLTQQDAVNYVKNLAAEARQYGMATGLKNAETILSAVQNDVQFAVNEGCQTNGECKTYSSFLAAGKPVFHIEYANVAPSPNGGVSVNSNTAGLQGASPEDVRQVLCLERGLPGSTLDLGAAPPKAFSTVIKTKLLDGWALYCDGSYTLTPTMNVNTGGPQTGFCDN